MNNDQNPPGFVPASFFPQDAQTPSTPPSPVEQQGPKKRGGRRGPRTPKPDKPVKRGRPRKINKEIKTARIKQAAAAASADTGLKISVADALAIFRDLDAAELAALQKCILAVGGLGKKSRERVLAALARVAA